jgi:hypothetical protein
MSDSKENYKIWGEMAKDSQHLNSSAEHNDDSHHEMFQPLDDKFFLDQYPDYLVEEADENNKEANKNKIIEGDSSDSEVEKEIERIKADIQSKSLYGLEPEKIKGTTAVAKTQNIKDESQSSEATSGTEEDNDHSEDGTNQSILNMSNGMIYIEERNEEIFYKNEAESAAEIRKETFDQLKESSNIIIASTSAIEFKSINEERKLDESIAITSQNQSAAPIEEINNLKALVKELNRQIAEFNGWKLELDLELENNMMAIVNYEARELELREELEQAKEALALTKGKAKGNLERRFSFGGNEVENYFDINVFKKLLKEKNGRGFILSARN